MFVTQNHRARRAWTQFGSASDFYDSVLVIDRIHLVQTQSFKLVTRRTRNRYVAQERPTPLRAVHRDETKLPLACFAQLPHVSGQSKRIREDPGNKQKNQCLSAR